MTPPSDSSVPGSPGLQPLLSGVQGVPRAEFFARPNSHPFQNRTLLFTGADQQIKVGRSVARSKPSPNNGIFDCKGSLLFEPNDLRSCQHITLKNINMRQAIQLSFLFIKTSELYKFHLKGSDDILKSAEERMRITTDCSKLPTNSLSLRYISIVLEYSTYL